MTAITRSPKANDIARQLVLVTAPALQAYVWLLQALS